MIECILVSQYLKFLKIEWKQKVTLIIFFSSIFAMQPNNSNPSNCFIFIIQWWKFLIKIICDTLET